MKIHNRFIALALAAAFVLTGAAEVIVPLGYYESLNGLKGEALKNAAHKLIRSNLNTPEYGDGANSTWAAFYITDQRSDKSVVDRYSNNVRYFTSYGKKVSGMNIEHSFPKSWWGGSQIDAYRDIHNLMPSDATANSEKSNYPLGVVTVNDCYNNGAIKVGAGENGATFWEPSDEWKGDFARTYMYMATAYQDLTWQGSQAAIVMQNGTYPTLRYAYQRLYIKWAKADDVNELEAKRNDAVQSIQGNRNPFVDFPNLMEYIWGDSTKYEFNIYTTRKIGQPSQSTGPTDPAIPGMQGDGSKESPFNCAAAVNAAIATGQTATTERYYVEGYVVSGSIDNGLYGNATFKLADAPDGTPSFTAFRFYDFGGTKFTDVDKIKVGDKIVVYGNLVNYLDEYPETTAGGVLISINGEGPLDPMNTEGDGTEDNPFNCAAAVAKAYEVGSTSSAEKYHVRGYVVTSDISMEFGNATCTLADSPDGKAIFTAYRFLDTDGVKFEDENRIKVGDLIVVKGNILLYQNRTPEITQGGELICILTGVEEVSATSADVPVRYFNLQGVEVGADHLTPGLYITSEGKKILIKH